MHQNREALHILEEEIIACRKCPRLVEYREKVAREKRRAFRDWTYWAKPVPGFGDPRAKLFILGLAPAAHGANRTGRVCTCIKQDLRITRSRETATTACN
jgi:uracil-DNA glycosylase